MPEPVHTGLRPLGPYGEGYCTVCHFIEPLTVLGVIEPHYRGLGLSAAIQTCPGSYKTPPKLTPVTSRRAAFRRVAPTVACTVCGGDAAIRLDGRIAAHPGQGVQSCTGSLRYPASRTGERG